MERHGNAVLPGIIVIILLLPSHDTSEHIEYLGIGYNWFFFLVFFASSGYDFSRPRRHISHFMFGR